MFLPPMLNFLLVPGFQYCNPGDPYMRQLFPHYLMFLLPSKIVFSQQQAMEDDRSPTHNLLMEVRRELTELRSEVARCDNRIAYATPHQGHYLKIFDHHSFLSIARLATPTITESESFDVSVGSCGHQRDAHPQNPSDRATSGYQYSGALQAAKLMEWTHR